VRPPILFLAIAFGAGLWAGLDSFGVHGAWYVVAPMLVGATIVWRRTPLGAAVGILAVAGILWGGAAMRERAATCAGQWAEPPAKERGRGSGGSGDPARAAIVRLVDLVPAEGAGGGGGGGAWGGGVVDADVVGGACGGALRLRWPEGIAAPGGTAWVVAGRWLGAAQRGVLVVRRARILDAEPRGRGALRHRLAARTAALFGARAPIVNALVFAPRAALDADIRERYARSGLAHLLSISGLHVGFLAAWLALLLRTLRLPPRLRIAASAIALLAYLWLLGFPAPALRAAAMLVVDDIARLRQRVAAPRGVVAVAALAVLLADPWALHSIGAWLSVTAIAAVIWAGRVTRRRHWGMRVLAPAAAATLLTAPITAFAFGTVAPIGVLANLVGIPLAAFAVPGLVMALALAGVLPGLAQLIAAGSGLGLALLDLTAQGAASVPGGHVVMPPGWGAAGLWLGVAAAAWWLWNAPRRPWLISARVAFLIVIFVAASFRDVLTLDDCRCLTVHFLDVGQGDAAALRTPNGRWIVIDGGPRTPQSDAGRRVVAPFLRRHRVGRLSLVVATHGDADHLGGLPAVVEDFQPQLVLEPGEPLGRPLYLEFLAAVEASGARWHPARTGDRVQVDGVVLDVLSPDSLWLSLPLDVNEHGVVVLVTFGAVRMLFQGDAGVPVEARLAGSVGPVELLKVGHHGSLSATSDAWLAELAPREAVISVGAGNRYGHPAPEVLASLIRHGVAIRRTDRAGTITFSTDGQRAHIDLRHHD
jgi:competence protein ComEC